MVQVTATPAVQVATPQIDPQINLATLLALLQETDANDEQDKSAELKKKMEAASEKEGLDSSLKTLFSRTTDTHLAPFTAPHEISA